MISEVVVTVIKLGSAPSDFYITETQVVAPGSGSYIGGNRQLVDVIRVANTFFRGVQNTGAVFSIFIVKISEVVVTRSGRVPITFTVYVPAGFDLETKIFPVV